MHSSQFFSPYRLNPYYDNWLYWVNGDVINFTTEIWDNSFNREVDLSSYPNEAEKAYLNSNGTLSKIESYSGNGLYIFGKWNSRVQFFYDESARLIRSVIRRDRNESETEYIYDENNNMHYKNNCYKHIYDNEGKLISTEYRDSDSNQVEAYTLIFYDEYNRLLRTIEYGYYVDEDGEDVDVHLGLKEIFNTACKYEELAEGALRVTEETLEIQSETITIDVREYNQFSHQIKHFTSYGSSKPKLSQETSYAYDEQNNWVSEVNYSFFREERTLTRIRKRKIEYQSQM